MPKSKKRRHDNGRGKLRRRKWPGQLQILIWLVCFFIIGIGLLISVVDRISAQNQTQINQKVIVTDVTKVPEVDVTQLQARKILAAYDLMCDISASVDNSAWISEQQVMVVGSNSFEQCDTVDWPEVRAVCLGDQHVIGLTMDGNIVFAGSNENDQQMLDTGGKSVRSIAAGPFSSFAVLVDGTVKMAGTAPVMPSELEAERNVMMISASQSHVLLLYADGTVKAYGENRYGECEVLDWKDIVYVACGYQFSVALDAYGNVYFVGDSRYGLSEINGISNIRAITAGVNTCLAVTQDGNVLGFGSNGSGQLNVTDWSGIVKVAAGYMHTIGLDEHGELFITGN